MTVYFSAQVISRGGSLAEIDAEFADIAGPIPVREVEFEMSQMDFVSMFKRFEVVLTRSGLDIKGLDFTVSTT